MIAMTTSNLLRLHINDHDFDSSLYMYEDHLSLRIAPEALFASTRNRLAPEVVQYG